MKSDKINPQLRDVFDTALKTADAKPSPQLPTIIINGKQNVLSWGGGIVNIGAHLTQETDASA